MKYPYHFVVSEAWNILIIHVFYSNLITANKNKRIYYLLHQLTSKTLKSYKHIIYYSRLSPLLIEYFVKITNVFKSRRKCCGTLWWMCETFETIYTVNRLKRYINDRKRKGAWDKKTISRISRPHRISKSWKQWQRWKKKHFLYYLSLR